MRRTLKKENSTERMIMRIIVIFWRERFKKNSNVIFLNRRIIRRPMRTTLIAPLHHLSIL